MRARHRQANNEWHLHMVHDTPTLTVDAAHEQQPSVYDDESTATAQAAIAWVVAPAMSVPGEVEKAADDVRLYRC